MLKAIEDLILYLADNWRSLTIQGALTAAIVIFAKRIGIQQLKKLLHLKDNSELTEIHQKLDRIMEAMGCATDSNESMTAIAERKRMSSILPQQRSTIVRIAGRFIHYLIRRVNNMNKFKSRKFILAVVSALLIILNDGLDLGIDSNTVLVFAGIIATWIIGESAVDMNRAGNGGDLVAYNKGDSNHTNAL